MDKFRELLKKMGVTDETIEKVVNEMGTQKMYLTSEENMDVRYPKLKGDYDALTKQYSALLETEGIRLDFTDDGLKKLAEIAYRVNSDTDNIGARRLHTVMEKLLEDVSFKAEEYAGSTVTIDGAYVDQKLGDIASSQDVSRYIL